MEIFASKFQEFSALFARMLAMFAVTPFFGGQVFSYFYRIALAFWISLMIVPVLNMPPQFAELIQTKYMIILLEQAIIGFMIGIGLQILFASFQMAGEFFSVQMGFGISEVFDPLAQISLPLLGTIKNLIALFVFFVSGSHLWIIRAVVFSFEKIPYFELDFLTNASSHQGIMDYIILLSSGMFIVALKIALPIMGTLLMVSITLGILSKAAPQMNILMLGFPLKILVAFLVLTLISPVIVELMLEQFDLFFNHLDTFLKAWAGKI